MEKDNGLQVIKLSDDSYMKIIQISIENGNPVLLEEIGEKLDSLLYPVLLKDTFTQGIYILNLHNLFDYIKLSALT